ncbi:MAG TPA: NAD-dependent epimerase/dehydratase family protein [Anaerolineaceae bacterium]|jgi:UDP-glucose 4-epimerase|nr:NAD-dependent epimerase/dehydratase family protein [Candidatus Cloacimonadota bacterium]NMC17683.1 NAD-dependent epimerase/dehydratase family protein [Chloroflexota bacterium]HNS07865.1 NAD-dependent epimerase/dehydratase family protein [Anaerolineaceae bacterium]HNW14822.1 NAD-dependent epimerase/dehydratase family protein [Anaerolineaceae bacterium]HOG78026.1 NAD-dependent epimerase/dehydratase family protein [Anaerolineaceae bacterium]
MRYLITGAAGFLGSALANRLTAAGDVVIGVDDLSAGDQKNLSPTVQFVRGDVNDRPTLWSLLQEVDCVYHLAAKVSVQESVLYPREYNNVNVGGTVTLMEAMRDVGVRRVVFISSGTVYGNQPVQPVKETVIVNPRVPYAVSKLAAEYYVKTIGSLWGIETVCLRVFNAYGPGQRIPPVHTPVIPGFLHQAWENGTIVIHGDGNQTRDYVYVDDVVNAMLAAANAPDVNKLTINVGSGTETSVRDLARMAIEVTGGNPEVVYNPRNEGGISRLRADISLARELLAYEPEVELLEGLKRTLAHDTTTDKTQYE